MRRAILITLGCLWSLSAVAGPSYAGNDGFLASVRNMVASVGSKTDLVGGINYAWNDAPSSTSTALPAHQDEWGIDLGATVTLNPNLLLFSSIETGIDNRQLRTKVGISRHLWSGGK